MSHREFIDPNGVRWEVWDVHPTHVERRRHSGGVSRPDSDRRRERTGPHIQVREEFLGGWLAFQSRDERRRLAPLPEGWESLDEDGLVQLCERAIPVGTPRRLVE